MSARLEYLIRSQPTQNDAFLFNLQHISLQYPYLCLFGVGVDGRSIAVEILHFQPRFWLDNVKTEDELDELREKISFELVKEKKWKKKNEDEDDERDSEAARAVVESVEFDWMIPFIGFTNLRKDRLVKIVCTGWDSYYRVRKWCKEETDFPIVDDFAIANQFFQSSQCYYQGWFRVQGDIIQLGSTSANQEIRVKWNNTSIIPVPLTLQPKILICVLVLQCVSSDGAVYQMEYHPHPKRAGDRITAMGLAFRFTDEPTPCYQVIHTWLDCESYATNPHLQIKRHANEEAVLLAVNETIITWDPDVIAYFPDFVHPLHYFYERCNLAAALQNEHMNARFTQSKHFMNWERFQNAPKCSQWFERVQCRTRALFDIQASLKKKVTIQLEGFDLYTAVTHPDLRKDKSKETRVFPSNYSVNQWVRDGEWAKCIDLVTLHMNLILTLEQDCGLVLEFANISRISDTSLTDVVSRGEQIRVFNKLTHFIKDKNYYINRKDLNVCPKRFSAKTHPPTFQDPDEPIAVTQLRKQCYEELEKKKKHWDNQSTKSKSNFTQPSLFDDEEEQEEEDEVEGGNVMKPCPRYWGNTRIGIFDFASLYPSIMRGFNCCYSTIVGDVKYLNLEGIKYIFVSINADETVAIVQNVKGIIPALLTLLVGERKAVKKLMEEASGFEKNCLNKRQESIKVICNATYGFCGAEKKGALLAMKPMLYVVTSLGRYLQKQAGQYLYVTYGIVYIYGDTDSLFVKLGVDDPSFIQSKTSALGKKYKMGADFNWDFVCQHYLQRKPPLQPIDITTLSPPHQLNAVLGLIFPKLSGETPQACGFPPEIVLEFENMALNVLQFWTKKTYVYWFYDLVKDPCKPVKMKMTGMAAKKREICLYTRRCLNHVQELLIRDTPPAIVKKYVLECFANMTKAKIDDLQVSRAFKGIEHYKHDRQPHLQVVHQLEMRHRRPITPGDRVSFVIAKGEEKLYERAVCPQQNRVTIDYAYYLSHQFFQPMAKLLTFHPEIMNFPLEFDRFMESYTAKMNGLCNWDQFDNLNAKKRKLTLEDFREGKKNE